ncbi:MAG: IS110 family transposase, partial [Gammaproteobacteria bacterium]
FGGKPLAVCLELNKGPLVYALQKYDFFVLFPVNPSTLAKYREAFTPSHAKDDPTDAELQLELLVRHRDKLQPLCAASAPMRALQQLVASRRRLVGDKVRITNRLTSTLKNYYPQALRWFEDKDTQIFCDFLTRWSTLRQAQRARKSSLYRFFSGHQVRYPHVIEQRVRTIKTATALTTDVGVIEPNALLVQALVSQLRVILAAIHRFDSDIKTRCQSLADYPLFESSPGAGPVFTSRLIAAFGKQRERYTGAAELQQYAGIAPVTERSGNKSWVHWRTRCPAFLRQTFVEWAGQTILHSFWAAGYYRRQRDKGCSHQAATRPLAFKWIRILYRCWQDRTPYDESVYLKALKQRGSPLLQYMANST